MKQKIILGVIACVSIFLISSCVGEDDPKSAETGAEQEIAVTSWNDKKTLSEKQGDYTFFAHESDDRKSSWIYQIKVAKKGTKQELIIPESIKGRTVIKIGADMSIEDPEFYQNVFGTYVEACHGCDGSNEFIRNIPAIQIPDTVMEIENSAFSGLDSIRKLNLPKNLQKMGYDAFYSCDNLEEIYVPEQYEDLCGDSVFRSCLKVEKIDVSEKNKKYRTIHDMLFSKDGTTLLWVPSSIENVAIPENTKVVEANAFSYSKACEVKIPASVEKIKENAFYECPYIYNLNLDEKNKVYEQDGTCIYESKTKRLALSMVQDHKLTISDRVKIIPETAAMIGGFDENEKNKEYPSDYPYVERADVPASVTKLEEYWDSFCSTNEYSAERLYFHSTKPPKYVQGDSDADTMSVTRILYVPVQALDAYKKWYRKGEYKTYIDGEKKTERNYTYRKGSDSIEITKYVGKEKKVIIPQEIEGLKVIRIGRSAFEKAGVVSVKIPDTVSEIEARAFFGCKSLETVVLPKQIHILHGKCFKNCGKLKEISIPQSVESIHQECFAGCTSLKKVDMPENLKETQAGVFKNCKSLKSIVLPKGLDSLSGELFMGCENLETVDVKGEIIGLGSATFCNCYKLKRLEHVKIWEIVYYDAFKNCKSLQATIEIMPGCEEISCGAFHNCPKVKVKNIENAKYVDKEAFKEKE